MIDRRTFLKAGAIGAASLALPQPAGASLFQRAGTVQWGAFSRPRSGEDFIQAIKRLENLIDRKLDVTRHYLHWHGQILTDAARWSAAGGRIPFIAWATNGEVTWRQIIGGNQDAHIRDKARKIRDWGHPAVFCFDHEPEAMLHQFGAGTAPEFAKAFDRVHRIFNDVGATNVKWACVLQGGTFHGGNGGPGHWYPQSHQILGSDGYNRHSNDWVSFKEIFTPGYNQALRQGKPFMIGEWGCQEDPRKDEWMVAAANTMRNWDKLSFVVYTHAVAEFDDKPVDFRVNSNPAALSAFRKIGHTSYFSG